jgi:hypothetical protein
MEGPWAAMATTCIFLAAVVTDWLDGYIARKVCQKIFSELYARLGCVPVCFKLILCFMMIWFIYRCS